MEQTRGTGVPIRAARCRHASLQSEVATPEPDTTGRFALSHPWPSRTGVMVTDPDLLVRLSQFPFIHDGRITLHSRRGGYSLYDALLDQPIVRIRPTGSNDQVVLLNPDPRGGWMPPGTLGDPPMSLKRALNAIEGAIAFLDHLAKVAEPFRRRRPLQTPVKGISISRQSPSGARGG